MHQKNLIGTLIIIIVLLAGAVVYLTLTNKINIDSSQQKSSQQTLDNDGVRSQDTSPQSSGNIALKNYHNELFGFDLQYPEYWVQNSYPEGHTESALEYKDASIVLSNFGHGFPFDWESEESTLVIDGKQVNVTTYTKGGKVMTKIVAITVNAKNLGTPTIQIELTGTIDESMIRDFDQIISTFKFTR